LAEFCIGIGTGTVGRAVLFDFFRSDSRRSSSSMQIYRHGVQLTNEHRVLIRLSILLAHLKERSAERRARILVALCAADFNCTFAARRPTADFRRPTPACTPLIFIPQRRCGAIRRRVHLIAHIERCVVRVQNSPAPLRA
jgi:hypothetical protein